MIKSNYEFEVLIHGSAAKEYYHEGSYYIEGKQGSRFSLKMRNNSNERALFVPTVDGLSIMDGKEGSFKSGGYIVNAYDSLTIDGWRTSDDNIAEFFFSTPKESYAKKMSKGNNLGVIGCAVFKEKEKVKVVEKIIIEKEQCNHHHCNWNCPNYWPTFTVNSGSNGGSAFFTSTSLNCNTSGTYELSSASLKSTTKSSSMDMSAGLGTGFGQDKYSPVITVEFEKESSPTTVFSLFYNTRHNLEAMGVEFKKPVYVAPSAFPKENGYCKRPN